MEGIKYINLIEIGPVVIDIRGAENGELAIPVNNILVSHMAFLAADIRPCVSIYISYLGYIDIKSSYNYLYGIYVRQTPKECKNAVRTLLRV